MRLSDRALPASVMIPGMPWWASCLPSSPERLATLDTMLRILAVVFAVLAVLAVLAAVCGLLAAMVATHRGNIRSTHTERALGEARARVNELEERAAPRQPRPEQRRRLVGLLSPWKGTSVLVMAVHGNAERRDYALQLADALREAGWTVTSPEIPLFGGGVVSRVAVLVNDEMRAPPGAAPLVEMLTRVGVAAHLLADRQVGPDALWLLVGDKP